MPRISSYRLSACSSSRQAGRPAAVLAFRWRSVITFLVSPVPFPLAFSMFFGAYRASPQSESEREGHSVSFHAERPMPSLRYPSRFPACRAERVACRGVWRGERRDVLWNVSHETWALPRAFLDAV